MYPLELICLEVFKKVKFAFLGNISLIQKLRASFLNCFTRLFSVSMKILYVKYLAINKLVKSRSVAQSYQEVHNLNFG